MRLLVCLSFAAALLASGAALAQSAPDAKSEIEQQQQRSVDQPGNNAPVMREIKSGQPQYTSIPGRETNVLVQPPARFLGQSATVTAGEAWRQFRNGPVTFIGGWLVVGVALVLLAFYFVFGPVKLHGKPTGRLVRRFSSVDQVVHWSVAISFCILGLSGLIMLFGKHVAAADHRLHAVRVAHRPRQEPAQLHCPGIHRFDHCHDRVVPPAQPAQAL